MSDMQRLAFVTYAQKPAISVDDELLATELRKLGFSIEGVPLDGAHADVHWQRFDAVIVRSPWNYHQHPEKFATWIERIERLGVRVLNPPRVMRWNMHKFYLRDLQHQGFRIPETVWIDRNATLSLTQLFEQTGWQQAVIKPAISATAFHTLLVESHEAETHQAAFDAIIRLGDVLAQQFMPAIRTEGEWSLMFFEKAYSHAVVKKPRLGDFRVQNDFGGTYKRVEPPPALVELGIRLLQRIPEPLPYARIDGIWADSQFFLMELELIEPMLFLEADPPSAQRMAVAISKYL
jgi:glutathione synthase/RimK-type ligase-like ATP-grasp enzyme